MLLWYGQRCGGGHGGKGESCLAGLPALGPLAAGGKAATWQAPHLPTVGVQIVAAGGHLFVAQLMAIFLGPCWNIWSSLWVVSRSGLPCGVFAGSLPLWGLLSGLPYGTSLVLSFVGPPEEHRPVASFVGPQLAASREDSFDGFSPQSLLQQPPLRGLTWQLPFGASPDVSLLGASAGAPLFFCRASGCSLPCGTAVMWILN